MLTIERQADELATDSPTRFQRGTVDALIASARRRDLVDGLQRAAAQEREADTPAFPARPDDAAWAPAADPSVLKWMPVAVPMAAVLLCASIGVIWLVV